ncbi:MAG: DUF3576 domain-containing protein [Pseudomonadota bacterium]|nr:DUF3576 domain-containing protein [Pseudomonadota bacterium]
MGENWRHRTARLALIAATAMGLAACESLNPFSDDKPESSTNQAVAAPVDPARQSVGSRANAYLWQSALETISFMPIETASEAAGLIETGWYIPPAAPTERFRLNVSFLSRALRPEAFQIQVWRQELRPEGVWVDREALPAVRTNLEETILFRALQLRQKSGVL